MIGRCNSRVKPMNTTHPLKMTPDRYDHPVHGPLNVCILIYAPHPTITWVRGPPARLVRCGAGMPPHNHLSARASGPRCAVWGRNDPHNHPGARVSGPRCAVWGWNDPPASGGRRGGNASGGHNPPLEWESVHPNDATPAQSPMGYGRFVNRPF